MKPIKSTKAVNMIEKHKDTTCCTLSIVIYKEDNYYVADCPALKLSSHGKTVKKAQENFQEALDSWIEVVTTHNCLDSALAELGWKKSASSCLMPASREIELPKNDHKVSLSYIPFNIPPSYAV